MRAAFYNTEIPPILPAGTYRRQKMDKFEEIGRRIDAEMERLRRYMEEEVAPETERRTASFLRDVSAKLDEFAAKLEARMSRRTPAPQDDPKP